MTFALRPGPLIMGILNVTPDSFCDGGRHMARDAAVGRALEMLGEGADIIDVGGESTRPRSEPVSVREQQRRVVDVIKSIRDVTIDAPPIISIDTTSDQVAEAALKAGADWVDDTSAGRDSPNMLPLAAERGAPLVLMHRQGTPRTMQQAPSYCDVVA